MISSRFENKFLKAIKPYSVASHTIWEKPECSAELLKLDWNEATIPPSEYVLSEISAHISTPGLNFYPDVKNRALLDILAEYSGADSNQIQYFSSSDSAHEYISECFLNEGDNVLILGPTYDNFRLSVESEGAVVDYYYYDIESFELDCDGFSKAISDRNPKMVYICNPNNPTGSVLSKDYIEQLLEIHNDVLFVIDEAYYEFCGISSTGLVKKHENIIVTRTFSKAFALAGMRIGYVIADEKLIASLDKVRNSKNITSLSQVAAIAAIKDFSYTDSYVKEVLAAKDLFKDMINHLYADDCKCYAGQGNFVLIRYAEQSSKLRVITHLRSNGIFVRDLNHTGLTDSIRITIGTREQMLKVISVMKMCSA